MFWWTIDSLKQHYVEIAILCDLVPSTVPECNNNAVNTNVCNTVIYPLTEVTHCRNKFTLLKTLGHQHDVIARYKSYIMLF